MLSGPQIIAGDFNTTIVGSNALQRGMDKGWVDVAVAWAARERTVPEVTHVQINHVNSEKNATSKGRRIDQLWCNAVAYRAVTGVRVVPWQGQCHVIVDFSWNLLRKHLPRFRTVEALNTHRARSS